MKHVYSLLFLIALLFSCTKKENIKKEEKGNPFYDKAYDYRQAKKIDSALLYFYKAKDLFLQQGDNFGAGKCLVNMAILLSDKGDNFGSQELSLEAIAYFNKEQQESFPYIKSNFNNLGITSFNLKNYSQAIDFYKEALKYAQDSISIWTVENNIANGYRKKKAYQASIDIYNNILRKKLTDELFAKVLSNAAYSKWLQNPGYNPKPDLLKALAIRKRINDVKGQTTSYDHLSGYFRNQTDSALFYARLMYNTSRMLKEPDDKMEALQKLILLSPPEETRKYFEIYHRLDDSLKTARAAAKNQFALIRYGVEKSKAENLKLQKENTEKKYKIARQEILMVIVLLTVAAIAVISVLWYKKRKQRIELEAEKLVHENQLRTSKKVHDVVANGLYRVMKGIDSHHTVNKGQLLDEIEELYEKSRDISYDPPLKPGAKNKRRASKELVPDGEYLQFSENETGEDLDFHVKITKLLSYFFSDSCLISIVSNGPDIWEKTSTKVRYEVEHILQEMMVNMSKHSKATRVVVRFEVREDWIYIHYTDNGVGMPEGTKHNNGLRNTGNRIEDIRGAITFDTQAEKGLKIQISFPIS